MKRLVMCKMFVVNLSPSAYIVSHFSWSNKFRNCVLNFNFSFLFYAVEVSFIFQLNLNAWGLKIENARKSFARRLCDCELCDVWLGENSAAFKCSKSDLQDSERCIIFRFAVVVAFDKLKRSKLSVFLWPTNDFQHDNWQSDNDRSQLHTSNDSEEIFSNDSHIEGRRFWAQNSWSHWLRGDWDGTSEIAIIWKWQAKSHLYEPNCAVESSPDIGWDGEENDE